jgi:O-antigen biosynthesis protein
LMVPKTLWNQLGGFDDRYAPAYYEETDLAFAMRAAGYKVIYQPRAEVVHFEGQTNGTDTSQGLKQYQVINQKTFATKWRTQLQAHRINGMLPHLERDRQGNTAKRRVLVLDACMLTPDQDSGSLRMFEMLGQMQQLGCKVTFVASNLETRTPYAQDIQALGVEVRWHPYLSSITTLIEREGASFDVIMLSRVTVACQFVDLVRQHAPHAKLIFDTVDLHFLRNERLAELETDANVKADILASAKKMRDEELSIIEKSDITLVVSTVEQTLLQEIAPRATVKIVSNIHVNDPDKTGFAEREGILFIGGFRHPPNLDAITWYAEKVLPILRRDLPGVMTTCIGSNAPAALEKLEAPDFHVAGFVQNIVPAYAATRISISPLRYGAGVKGKVNIAMQYGVPVVATLCSVEGMHLIDGEDAMVGDTPEAFAAAIVKVYTDAALWQRLRAGGHRNIDTYFSRDTARHMLAKVLDIRQ